MKDAMTYSKDADGIVTITMDMPDRSVNVINQEFGDWFAKMVEQVAADEGVKGVIIASAKKTFVAGAELEYLARFEDPEEVFAVVETMKAHQRTLETMGIPVAAAVNGSALGGGWEVALACHCRIAIDDPKTKLGLPEVTLGLLPGDGGITRMTRLLGLQGAFPYLTEGRQFSPQQALEAGLVDELAVDTDDLMKKVRAWIAAHPESAQPWDRDGYRMPGGSPSSPRVAPALLVAPAMIQKKTFRNFPAPECIAAAMVEGAAVDFDTALRIESRYFASVATSKVAKNMISAFWFQLNSIKNGESRPSEIGPTQTEKVGILGAGLMGHGIAYVTAYAGMEVVLKDVSAERAEAGKQAVSDLLNRRVKRGRMTEEKAEQILARITPTAEAADLSDCDLVIEAVFEDRKVKAAVTREAEAAAGAKAVIASNTSTLPITGLAEASSRPENYIGLHFFSPVHRMNLVEIIVGKKSSRETLAKVFDYVLKINKTPIVVNDSRGFYTSRVFGTYVKEGLELLVEGQNPRAIESAGLKAGMPMGPLEVADMVGLSLVTHIAEQTEKDLAAEGKAYAWSKGERLVEKLVKDEQRTGKGGGKGFYDYDESGKKLWPGVRRLAETAEKQLEQQEMIDRLLFIQALETVKCRDEGVIESVADANLGSVFGWGFAPHLGGTLQSINSYGVPEFIARCRQLAAAYGSRFEPLQSLETMAENHGTF